MVLGDLIVRLLRGSGYPNSGTPGPTCYHPSRLRNIYVVGPLGASCTPKSQVACTTTRIPRYVHACRPQPVVLGFWIQGSGSG